jgi:indole-3-glycerol phosphate synthase
LPTEFPTMSDRLKQIIDHKRTEVERLLPLAEKLRYAAAERNDFRSLHHALSDDKESLAIISEIKKASPSAGIIAEDFDPVLIAQDYAAAGADAISVLTDERFFQGHLSFLAQIRQAVDLPLLRKDFIIHETQIWEAVVAGADAILLIVAALEQDELHHLLEVAATVQLDVLVEVHNLPEMERALQTEASIIGINNRNLKSFEVDLAATELLSQEVGPDHILVSESGILNGEDSAKVREWGADAILVGEALMRSPDKTTKMAELRATSPDDHRGDQQE